MMTNIFQGFLSGICITIPENLFMVIITIRILGRKDLLDLYNIKENLKIFLKIVFPSSLLINFLDFIIKTPDSFNKTVAFITLYLSLIYILKKYSTIEYPKLYKKTLAFFVLSILIAISIEMVTMPIILKLTNRTFEEIKINLYLVLLCSLSSRIIDILIIGYIFIRKNNKFQMNVGDYIFKNTFFMRMIIGIVLGLIVFEIYIVKLILHNNLLNIINTIYEQLFVVIGSTFFIPSLIISIVYSCINYCITIINSEKQTIRND